STWSVMPAAPRTIAAGQLCPPSEASTSATKTGIRTRRPRVSAFGICATGAGTVRAAMLKGYGGLGDPYSPGLRQRAQSCVSARLARPHRGRGLLGLARVDAGPRRGTVPGTGPFRVRPGLPGDAGSRLHRGRG